MNKVLIPSMKQITICCLFMLLLILVPTPGDALEIELMGYPYGREISWYVTVSDSGDVNTVQGIHSLKEGFGEADPVEEFVEIKSTQARVISESETIKMLFQYAEDAIHFDLGEENVLHEVGRIFIRYDGVVKWWYVTGEMPIPVQNLLYELNPYIYPVNYWERWDAETVKEFDERLPLEKLRAYYANCFYSEEYGHYGMFEYVLTNDQKLIISYGSFSNASMNREADFRRNVEYQEIIPLTALQEQEIMELVKRALSTYEKSDIIMTGEMATAFVHSYDDTKSWREKWSDEIRELMSLLDSYNTLPEKYYEFD